MPGILGKYRILRTLGSGGSCKVKLGVHMDTGEKVAVKIMSAKMDRKTQQLIITEVQAMERLKHRNIIEQKEVGIDVYRKTSGKQIKVSYIIMELALGGELFDFIANSGPFQEDEARYYFKQFMSGLDFCHQNQVAHRDLKPENLLIGKNFDLKIADFGFAGPIEGRNGKGFLYTKLGTLNYMAPEIHLEAPYQGKQVDLFSAAMILFIMVAQHPPFSSAQAQDPYYKCIAGNRADIFWRTHCKNKPKGDHYFSEELKELLTCMFQVDPTHRPSMAEIISHSWMRKPTPTRDQIYARFKQRDKMVRKEQEMDRLMKQKAKNQRLVQRRVWQEEQRSLTVPSSGNEEQPALKICEEEPEQPKKSLEEYQQVFSHNTEFFTSYSPDHIEETFVNYLRKEKIEPIVSKNKYKIKFLKKGMDELNSEVNDDVEMCVRILQVPDRDVFCVEFCKISGNQTTFLKLYEYYKNDEDSLSFANDACLEEYIDCQQEEVVDIPLDKLKLE